MPAASTPFYKILRQKRLEFGYTLSHLSKALNVTIAALSKIECGKTDISYSRLEQLADFYKTSIPQLLSGGKPVPVVPSILDIKRKQLEEREAEASRLRNTMIGLLDEIMSLKRGKM